MRRIAPPCVFVFAVLTLQLTSTAQEYMPDDGQHIPVGTMNPLKKFAMKRTGESRLPEGAFNGFAQNRMTPDLGAPGSAGMGFSHFPMPMDRYTNWYRPRAATLTQYQRCAPDSFRPRGFGHLFNRPCDGYRMEYEPYALSDGMSVYGPSYPARLPDPRCQDCDCIVGESGECPRCYVPGH